MDLYWFKVLGVMNVGGSIYGEHYSYRDKHMLIPNYLVKLGIEAVGFDFYRSLF